MGVYYSFLNGYHQMSTGWGGGEVLVSEVGKPGAQL